MGTILRTTEAELSAASNHFAYQVMGSLVNVADADRPVAARFLNRFAIGGARLPEDEESLKMFAPANFIKTPIGRDHHLVALLTNAFPVFSIFFRPDYKCSEDKKFPSPCDYEVLIPYAQPNTDYIWYSIIPAGAKAGQTVVTVVSFMANALTPFIQNTHKPLSSYGGRRIPFNKVTETLKNLQDNRDAIPKEIGGSGTMLAIIQLKESPCLRLPLYNLPLQCAYELAIGDAGGFVYDLKELWKQLVARGETKLMIERKPIDKTLLYTSLSWSSWNYLKLSEPERMEYLSTCLAMDGLKLEYVDAQSATLFRKVRRMFEDQLKRNHSFEVVPSKPVEAKAIKAEVVDKKPVKKKTVEKKPKKSCR